MLYKLLTPPFEIVFFFLLLNKLIKKDNKYFHNEESFKNEKL